MDYLRIYDGDYSSTTPFLGTPGYCGVTLPPSLISSSNHLFISFHSNHDSTGTGFKLEYSATSKSSYSVDSCTLCARAKKRIKKL